MIKEKFFYMQTTSLESTHTTDWAQVPIPELTKKLLIDIKMRLENSEQVVPSFYVPFSEKTYFTHVDTIFPGSFSEGVLFLGQILMEEHTDKLASYPNKELANKVKSLKNMYGVTAQSYRGYCIYRSTFWHIPLVRLFNVDVAFFNAVARAMNNGKNLGRNPPAFSNRVCAHEREYRNLFLRSNENKELLYVFNELHLRIFLGWLKASTKNLSTK